MFDVLLTETIWLPSGNAGPKTSRVLQSFATADEAWCFYVNNRHNHEMLDNDRMVRIAVCHAGKADAMQLVDYYRLAVGEETFRAQDEDEAFAINLDLWLRDRFAAGASA